MISVMRLFLSVEQDCKPFITTQGIDAIECRYSGKVSALQRCVEGEAYAAIHPDKKDVLSSAGYLSK